MGDLICPVETKNIACVAKNDLYALNGSEERIQELAAHIRREIYKPIYEFAGCLGPGENFRRYTKLKKEL